MTVKRIRDVKRIAEIVRYGATWHARSQYGDIMFDKEMATETIRAAMQYPNMALWVSEINNELKGMCIGIMLPFSFSRRMYAADLIFVADAEGARMFYKLRNWARENGAVRLQMGVTSGIGNPDKVGEFYIKSGLTKLGGIYSQNFK